MTLTPGTWVYWKDRRYVLLELLSASLAAVREEVGGELHAAPISELKVSTEWAGKPRALIPMGGDAWQRATAIMKVIVPLVRSHGNRPIPAAEVERAASDLGCSRATVYRYIASYRQDSTLMAFCRQARSDKGRARIDDAVDEVIKHVLKTDYLNRKRGDVVEALDKIEAECLTRGLKIPSPRTVHRRIMEIPQHVVVGKREGSKKKRYRFEPIRGKFPGAELPLMVYQIDHTPIDLILVDSVERKSVKRAYLTIVIDVCTRMIAGFFVAFDAPSALTAGIALGNAILTKEKWLAKLGIEGAEWPIFGFPKTIHLDNAKEFRGKDLRWSCEKYGIEITHRPKGLPHFGGHVERMFRTLMRRTKRIPGATFSNIAERGDYNSMKHAVMTIDEYERWFALFVTKVYHNHQHKGLRKELGFKITPLQMYTRMVMGTEDQAGAGVQPAVKDERTLRMDLLPRKKCTIQREGVQWDSGYFHNVLRPYIGLKDPATGRSPEFIFARDPRDISEIYFLDDETGSYVPIPFADITRKPISLWAWRARRKVGEDAPEHISRQGKREMGEQVQTSTQKTAAARREAERERRHAQESTAAQARVTQPKAPPAKLIDRTFRPFPVDEN